jgi:magnesium transporter
VLRVLEYGAGRDAAFREIDVRALRGTVQAAEAAPILWVDVADPSAEELDALGETFGWHRLIRAALGERDDRQKLEPFGDLSVLVVLRPRPKSGTDDAIYDTLYVIAAEHVLVSVHDGCRDLIEAAGEAAARRPDLGQNRTMAAVTALLENVVDAYDDAVDRLEDVVSEQETGALQSSGDPVPALRAASSTRTAIGRLRRAAAQLRELLGTLGRRELVNVEHTNELDLELRDVLDDVVRIHDDLDMLHDRMSALADTRLAMVAYRQNEITKKLSAWGAILLVPTIVTGWFGQNFHHLEALAWTQGPLFAIAVMAVVMAGLYGVFRRNSWL